MNKKSFLLLIGIIAILGVAAFFKKDLFSTVKNPQSESSSADVFSGVSYVGVKPEQFSIQLVDEKIISPTRIKITPDGNYMLVSQLSGEVFAFKRSDKGWQKQSEVVVKVDTQFPGFPPEEGGLVGLVFSADYKKNGKLFLLYSYRDKDKKVLNRISSSTLKVDNGKLVGTPPQQIYEANIPGNVSHQITDGVGVMISNKPHLLFLVGEGFKAVRAQNPKEEAGKVLLITDEGNNPEGQRPYPDSPKVQAIGLRNAYVIAQNTFEKASSPEAGRFLIGDTGPDRFDRIIDTQLFSPTGAKLRPINLGWNGSEDDLEKPIPDPNVAGVKDIVIWRLPQTETFTGLAFHPGKGSIPESTDKQQSVLFTLFGKTGTKENEPGKEVVLGKLTGTAQPTLTTEPIIKRKPEANGKIGNPTALEIDLQTGDFFFADILENRIYQVIVNEED